MREAETRGTGSGAVSLADPGLVRYVRSMTKDVEEILAAALALPSTDRAHLLAVLADSVEHGEADAMEAAWAKEIERRLAAYRSGNVETHTAEDVEREAEALIADLDGPDIAAAG